jgi:amphi-Trp domain-containing protein
MSDVEVSREEQLTRAEVAERLAALAAALAGDEKVEVAFGATKLELHVPDEVRFELEIEVEDGEVELEIELKWSLAGPAAAAPTKQAPAKQAAKPRGRTAAARRVRKPGGR